MQNRTWLATPALSGADLLGLVKAEVAKMYPSPSFAEQLSFLQAFWLLAYAVILHRFDVVYDERGVLVELMAPAG